METEVKANTYIHFSVLSFPHETRFFFLFASFITFFSLSACLYVNICVCMHACTYAYIWDTVIFYNHCTVAPLTNSPSQKGRGIVNAKLAPHHANESAKAYIRMASSNNTNSFFSCSLFIGLDRQPRDRRSFLFLGS